MRLSRSFPRLYRGIPHLIAIAGLLAVACTPAAEPEPTTAPSKPAATTAPAKPSEKPAAEKPAAKPTTAEAKPAATTAPAKPAASPETKPAAKPDAKPSPVEAQRDDAAVDRIASELPEPEIKDLMMSHSTLENSQLAYRVALDNGLYQKYGLDSFEMVYTEGDANTLRALVSEAVDLTAQGVGVVVSSQLTDIPLVTISMTGTMLTDCITSQGDIQSAEDLVGGTLAISSFGGTSHGAALMALEALDLTTDQVTITQVGGQGARIAALEAGSVDAAIVDVALRQDMTDQGFNCLVALTEVPLEYGRNGLNVRKEWEEENPNTTLALVAAVLEGQNLIWTDTDGAVESMAEWAQIPEDEARQQVEFFKTWGRRDMRWTPQAWTLTRDTLASVNPGVAELDPEEFYTYEYVDQLEELGLYDALGVPEYVPPGQR